MSKILVLITTDHEDHDQAVKSVSNAMKRAGYDFKDYSTHSHHVGQMFHHGLEPLVKADALVEVTEPEVSDRVN